jgi:hypothetical protein
MLLKATVRAWPLPFSTAMPFKRLTAPGMPVEQAEILADEHARVFGEQLATKQDWLCSAPTLSRWSNE